jgi:hypothetical protein
MDPTNLSLDYLPPAQKSGDERMHADGVVVGASVLDFWRWYASDLMSNATRGCLAEYLVHRAVGGAADAVRSEWDAFDLTTPEGVRVEVKSTAYIQSWKQARESIITFRVPKTRAWSSTTNQLELVAKRQADVYVFALLHERTAPDPMNVLHWTFFVVATHVLDARTRSQHSITLASLLKEVGNGVGFDELANTIRSIAHLTPNRIAADEAS